MSNSRRFNFGVYTPSFQSGDRGTRRDCCRSWITEDGDTWTPETGPIFVRGECVVGSILWALVITPE